MENNKKESKSIFPTRPHFLTKKIIAPIIKKEEKDDDSYNMNRRIYLDDASENYFNSNSSSVKNPNLIHQQVSKNNENKSTKENGDNKNENIETQTYKETPHFKKSNEEISVEKQCSNLTFDLKKNNEEELAYKTGRWTSGEHYRFIKGCLLFGNDWKKVKFLLRLKTV